MQAVLSELNDSGASQDNCEHDEIEVGAASEIGE
jgi:hypothetical protein